jgi:hypothetical protein
MSLQYLVFDHSENTDGLATFDTMASVQAAHWPAVLKEVAQVLAWAHQQFGGSQGQMDEPDGWDVDLQAQQEFSVPQTLSFDARTGRMLEQAQAAGQVRHNMTMTLSGGPAFGEAFRDAFGDALSDAP